MANVEQTQQSEAEDPAEKIIFHLLRHPYDLVDTRRLMRRFHASVADVQLALKELEQIMEQQAKRAAC